MPKTHELKCHPNEFDALLRGDKTVDLRVNDRDYQTGDTLHLREYDPKVIFEPTTVENPNGYPKQITAPPLPPGLTYGDPYTGRDARFTVTHVMHGGQWGIDPKWCALSVRKAPGYDGTLYGKPAMAEEIVNAKLAQASRYGKTRGDDERLKHSTGMSHLGTLQEIIRRINVLNDVNTSLEFAAAYQHAIDIVNDFIKRVPLNILTEIPCISYKNTVGARLVEEVPGIEPDMQYYIRRYNGPKSETIWQGPTAQAGIEWANAAGVKIDSFEPFEP